MITMDREVSGEETATGVDYLMSTPSLDTELEWKDYREAVETLLRLASGKVISNSLPSHAAILYEVFFKHAKNQIRIFCRNLADEVFGRQTVVDAAADALE